MRSGRYAPWMVRAIVKAGGNPVRNPSEINHQLACMSIDLAKARCEVFKARATIRGLLASKMIGKARK